MEIKHFVYGKFRDLIPDFDIRIISPGQSEATARNMAQRINRLRLLCALPGKVPPYIEYIGRLYPDQPLYAYVRFFPADNNQDDHGRLMVGFYHALLFNEQEMAALDMKPWKCRDLFIKGFDNEKITGWDHQVWLRREDLAHLGTDPKKIRLFLDQPLSGSDMQARSGLYVATDHYTQYIATVNPYSTLEDTDSQTLLHIFNAGIVLHYPVESGKMESIGGMAKFVSGRNSLPEEFKKNSWKNLPAASVRSYVSSFKPVVTRALVKPGYGDVGDDSQEDTGTADAGYQPAPQSGWQPLNAHDTREDLPVVFEQPPIGRTRWSLQNKIFAGALLVCLAGIGILSWKLYSTAGDASSSVTPTGQKLIAPADHAVAVVKPTPEVSVPPPPLPVAEGKVGKKEYDALRNEYMKLSDLLNKANDNYRKLNDSHTAVTSKANSLTREITGLTDRVSLLTGEKDVAAEEMAALKTEILSLKKEQDKFRKELKAKDDAMESLQTTFKEDRKNWMDSIKRLNEQPIKPSKKPAKP